MDVTYKIICDTPEKRTLALQSIESFLEDKPESGVAAFKYKNFHGTILVREMDSGNIVAHWQNNTT